MESQNDLIFHRVRAKRQMTYSPFWSMKTATEDKRSRAGKERYAAFMSSYCSQRLFWFALEGEQGCKQIGYIIMYSICSVICASLLFSYVWACKYWLIGWVIDKVSGKSNESLVPLQWVQRNKSLKVYMLVCATLRRGRSLQMTNEQRKWTVAAHFLCDPARCLDVV